VKTRPPVDNAPGIGSRRTQQPQPAGCPAEDAREALAFGPTESQTMATPGLMMAGAP
jgi:hypothetical protein